MEIDPDIRRARLPDASFYEDLHLEVLRRSWHLAPPIDGDIGSCAPFELAGVPLVLVRGENDVRCLSNVCTHRANLVVQEKGCHKSLRCRYHGRRFALDGTFVSMPEFEGAIDFPSKSDDLPGVSCEAFGPLRFVSIDPSVTLDALLAPVKERTSFLPWNDLVFTDARDYEVRAHWALYVENYLEGFHIPFVHAGLNRAIDYESYRTLTFDHASLQIGTGKEHRFDLPKGHPDVDVVAFYFWLFPTTMINVYPWGVSLNAVTPLAIDRTRVSFLTWVWDASKRERGAGADLHTVEMEDEAVVESVQRGIRSPLYGRGRYSPTREIALHHFHRLMTRG